MKESHQLGGTHIKRHRSLNGLLCTGRSNQLPYNHPCHNSIIINIIIAQEKATQLRHLPNPVLYIMEGKKVMSGVLALNSFDKTVQDCNDLWLSCQARIIPISCPKMVQLHVYSRSMSTSRTSVEPSFMVTSTFTTTTPAHYHIILTVMIIYSSVAAASTVPLSCNAVSDLFAQFCIHSLGLRTSEAHTDQ